MKRNKEQNTIKLQEQLLKIKILKIFMKHFFIILIFISNIGSGQKADTSYKLLDSVIVTSRSIKILDTKNPFVISSITNKQIVEKGARTTPEALQGVSGVFIQKTNHGGGSAFLRGLTGNQTLIVLDGIRLNNAIYRYGPNQYLNTIDMFTVDKIDVLKGIGAVEYGSDAMGGVIHVKTKENASKDLNKISLNNTSKFISNGIEKTNRTAIQYATNKWDFIGGISLKKYGDLVGGENIGKQNPTGYNELNYDLKTRIKLSNQGELIYSSQNTIQNNIPIYHKIVLENFKTNQTDYQIHYLNYLKYKYTSNKKWISEIIINASTQRSIEQRSIQKNNSSIFRNEADTVKNIGLTAEIVSKPNKNWTMNSGFDYYKDKIFSEAIETSSELNTQVFKRGLYPNGSIYKNSSIFNIHNLNFNKLNIVAGLRYNFLHIQMNELTLGNIAIKPSALVSNFGFNYQLNQHSFLFGSITTGYRAPNIDDLGSLGIVDFRYEIPSYDLRPEKSLNTEIGYKFRSNKIDFSIAAFKMKLKDIIARVLVDGKVISGYNVYNKKNIESSYINGAEVNYTYLVSKFLTWHTNATYTYGQNVTKNEPMRRIPPLFGQNKISFVKKNKTLAITHQFAGKQDRLAQGDKDDNRIGKLGTPGWNIFNIDAGWEFKNLSLNTSLINISNVQYKTHGSGVYGMGRAINLTIQWNIR
jgi:outer membrane receptor protein involved in Fe transport